MDDRLNFWITSGVLEHLQNANGVPITDDVAKYYFSYNLLNGPKASSVKDLDILGYPSNVGHTTHKCDGTFHTGLAPLIVDDSIFRTPATAHTPIGWYDPNFENQNDQFSFIDPRQLLCFPKRNCQMCWLYDEVYDDNISLPRMRPDPQSITVDIDGITPGSLNLEGDTLYYKVITEERPVGDLIGIFPIGYEQEIRPGVLTQDVTCQNSLSEDDWPFPFGGPTGNGGFDADAEWWNYFKYIDLSFINGSYILNRASLGIFGNPVEIPGQEFCNYFYRDNNIIMNVTYNIGADNRYDVGGTGCVYISQGYNIICTIRVISTGIPFSPILRFSKLIKREEFTNNTNDYSHYLPECSLITDTESDFFTTISSFGLPGIGANQCYPRTEEDICNAVYSGLIPNNGIPMWKEVRWDVTRKVVYVHHYEGEGVFRTAVFGCGTAYDVEPCYPEFVNKSHMFDPNEPFDSPPYGLAWPPEFTPIWSRIGPYYPILGPESNPVARISFDPEPQYQNPEIEWIHISETGVSIS